MSIFYQNTLRARIARKLSAIRHCAYLDVNPDHRAAVLVAGSGRSGTNWVAEVLNHDGAYRFIVEPFNREQVRESRQFSRLQYLRPNDDRRSFVDAAQAVFQGRVRSAWTDSLNRRLVARARLVKDVRSNLMLGWMARHFPGMKIVFVVRDPCAVAHSRLRLRWRARPRQTYFEQEQLMDDMLSPFRGFIDDASATQFAAHVLDWCVENYVPMRQLDMAGVHLVRYEALMSDREAELRRLFAFAGRPYSKAALERSYRPSATVFDSDAQMGGLLWRPHADWATQHSPSEIDAARRIVQAFGLDRLCAPAREPVLAAAAP